MFLLMIFCFTNVYYVGETNLIICSVGERREKPDPLDQ